MISMWYSFIFQFTNLHSFPPEFCFLDHISLRQKCFYLPSSLCVWIQEANVNLLTHFAPWFLRPHSQLRLRLRILLAILTGSCAWWVVAWVCVHRAVVVAVGGGRAVWALLFLRVLRPPARRRCCGPPPPLPSAALGGFALPHFCVPAASLLPPLSRFWGSDVRRSSFFICFAFYLQHWSPMALDWSLVFWGCGHSAGVTRERWG